MAKIEIIVLMGQEDEKSIYIEIDEVLDDEIEYLVRWVSKVISINTIYELDFKEWMWCPQRYSSRQLKILELIWQARREYKS